MLTANFHNPYDPLQGNDPVPEPVRAGHLVSKIGLGILGGLLLAAAGSLDPKDPEGGAQSLDRRALSRAAPEIVSITESPWGEAPGSDNRFSH